MNLPRSTDHGPPTEHPETGYRVCRKCHERYRWSSETGEYDREPYGACSGLKRGKLERESRLNPVSGTNSGRSHQKDEAFRAYVRNLPCLVCGQRPSDPHHVLTWGSGRGDWVEGRGNLAPLCRGHHQQVDAPGWGPETFEQHHGVDLESEAARIGSEFQAHRETREGSEGGVSPGGGA